MFYRATTSSVGTGLGLYICHEIITKLGGKIQLDSKLGAGTRVKMIIPLTA
jgi:signal transduction histidine kinase